jgi:hypothetical protein
LLDGGVSLRNCCIGPRQNQQRKAWISGDSHRHLLLREQAHGTVELNLETATGRWQYNGEAAI